MSLIEFRDVLVKEQLFYRLKSICDSTDLYAYRELKSLRKDMKKEDRFIDFEARMEECKRFFEDTNGIPME